MIRFHYYLLSLLLLATTCFGANRYVDGVNGLDTNNGSSLALAWKTIGHAMSAASPGDAILITGGIYREHIKLYDKSGSSGSPITVKNYDANEVVLDGSVPISSWTVDTGNIYKSIPGEVIQAIVIDNTPLKPAVTQTNLGASYTDTTTRARVSLSQGQFYQDNSTGTLYVWTPSGDSPANHTVGAIRAIPDTSNTYDAIYLWNGSYWNFENITIRFYGARGIECYGSNAYNNFKNVKIKFNGHTGILSGANSQLLDSEIAWNFMMNWPRGKFNGGTQGGGWGAGTSIGANSLVKNCYIYKNGGEGLLTYMNSGGTTFTSNTIYDNWSMNLYVDTAPNVIVENNLVYCTAPDMADAANNAYPTDTTIYKGLFPIGISTADEYYGGDHTNYLHDVIIRNNIVSNCRKGYNHYPQYSGSGMIRISIINNTIVTPDFASPGPPTPSSGDNFIGIMLNNTWGSNTGNVIKNNIVVSRNAANFSLYYETKDVDTFAPYAINNNLWYNTTSSTPIHWGSSYGSQYDRTLAQWQALPGTAHGQNDLAIDPNFSGGASIFTPSYYIPSSSSPALNKGLTLQGFSTDFYGRPRPSIWSIGALEGGALSSPPNIKRIIFSQ